jgi:hypothetical protein
MNEYKLPNSPFKVRYTHRVDGRIRLILPVLGAKINDPGVDFSDPELQRLLGKPSDDTRTIRISLFFDQIDHFGEAFDEAENRHLTSVSIEDGLNIYCNIPFDDFNDLYTFFEDMNTLPEVNSHVFPD